MKTVIPAPYIFFLTAAPCRKTTSRDFSRHHEELHIENSALQTSSWLAKRLGISITTVERLRAAGSTDLPPAVQIGRSIRYDESFVEQWLLNRLQAPVAQASIDPIGGRDALAA